MDEQTLKTALRQVAALRFFKTTGSTNDDALEWADQNAPDFSIVIADRQTAGRGRLQRRWITPAGTALAFSLILRPTEQETPRLALFTALGALALSDVLKYDYRLESQIKWPNDVLIEGQKTAGILAEASWQGGRPQAVILGIGVNVAPESVPARNQVLFPATCIEAALGYKVERVELLANLLDRIKSLRPAIGSLQFIQAWENRLAYKGKVVRIEQADHTALVGVLIGLEGDGSLRLQVETGKIVLIQAGDVRLRPVEANR
ncbi:MAG: biotin--[acetyl-CoA-carboxylase] ligase [Anaerolineae bacterium]|nr:biotin--[acetyl-CoA-carboxylase] ligase [Anaerolineae bacterium]